MGDKWEHTLEFECLGFALDDSGTNVDKCCRRVVSGKKLAGMTRYIVNVRSLWLEYAK